MIGRRTREDDGRKADIVQLANVTITSLREVQRRAAAGELSKDQAWVAARGAERFLTAAAKGDVVSGAERDRRIRICLACPTRVRATAPGADASSDWCGPPLEPIEMGVSLSIEGREVSGPSCGCLLAAKAWIGSEHCDQGRW